jgi:FlaA1/EpsC-like NDP-sugar epimerase
MTQNKTPPEDEVSSPRSSWTEGLLTLPRPVRMSLIAGLHATLFTIAFVAGFVLRFDFVVPEAWFEPIMLGLPIALTIKLVVFGLARMYQGWWRYVSLYDLVVLFQALAVAETCFLVFNVFSGVLVLPRSIYILDFGLSLVLVGGARGSLRLLREAWGRRAPEGVVLQNIMIIGAGDTGETLLREIGKNQNLPYRTLGFLDDAPHKQGLRINNVPVLGAIDELAEHADKHNVSTVLIAMPSATREQMRRVVDIARDVGVETRILPAVETILSESFSERALREVSISDLLGRAPVRLDMQSIGRFIQGRRVMVTGAGGSIGSELCRQVLRFAPSELVMVDNSETPLFFIHREVRHTPNAQITPYIASICDADRMRAIIGGHQPEVILHAAAYKHVPLMEANPCEAVKNNVSGTRVLLGLASELGVGAFVLISTDKAVNPTSVMGATKRITELMTLDAQRAEGNTTRFCAVRFGNVLGSNGSVVPIFQEQIKRGGPVTVTHKEMTRYFMTIPEAVQLVLQAGALGEGGEVFILDMGEPVKIADLARDMIRLSGLTLSDIEIQFTGVRPGEKLFEELTLNKDKVDVTSHEKIFVAHREHDGLETLNDFLDNLVAQAERGEDAQVVTLLKELIPTYAPPKLPDNVVPMRKKKPTGS